MFVYNVVMFIHHSQGKIWPKRTEARRTNEQTNDGTSERTNTSRALPKFIYIYIDCSMGVADYVVQLVNAVM